MNKSENNREILLSVSGVKKKYYVGNQYLFNKKSFAALNDVSLEILNGQIWGLVGESGCGKTTLGRCIIRLESIDEGKIVFDNNDITNWKRKKVFLLKKKMQLIFQDPYSSLNPRKKISESVFDALDLHKELSFSEKRKQAEEMLHYVGIKKEDFLKYPHELSGGQKQRISVARALVGKPELIICDEPVSALDVSIQAQILNLFKKIKEEHSLTYLFISHDLSVINFLCDYIMVMFAGTIIESGCKEDIFERPLHPYTRELLGSIPSILKEKISDFAIADDGEIYLETGCRYYYRCRLRSINCRVNMPVLSILEGDHKVACHHVN